MAMHVPPPAQFLLNHHTLNSHHSDQVLPQSHEGWHSPLSNTLEHNMKNKSHNFQNNLDTETNANYEPTCLMRTASGSLFIPKDGHKALGNSQANDFSIGGTMQKKNIDKTLPSIVPVRNHFARPLAQNGSRFHLRKAFSNHCSWKFASFALGLACLALIIAIIFLIGTCVVLKT